MGLKTIFIITVSTLRAIFPGIAPAVTVPGQAPPTVIPVTKSVSFTLFSDRTAGPGAYAWVNVPQSLGAGQRVALTIQRQTAQDKSTESDQSAAPKITQKTYWGSTDEIPKDQPRVGTYAQSASAQTLPDKSIAYWPSPTDRGLESSGTVPGAYTLDTNFAGATTVTLGPEQAFIPSIQFDTDADSYQLDKAIKIKWKPVPKALGYLLTAFGGTRDQSITWTSSAVPDVSDGLADRAISAEELKSLLDKKVLLPPESTTVTIPAGVFSGATGAMISVTAFGPDLIQDKGAFETRVIVRSMANIVLMAKQPDTK